MSIVGHVVSTLCINWKTKADKVSACPEAMQATLTMSESEAEGLLL